jgi:hypothetical protein
VNRSLALKFILNEILHFVQDDIMNGSPTCHSERSEESLVVEQRVDILARNAVKQ